MNWHNNHNQNGYQVSDATFSVSYLEILLKHILTNNFQVSDHKSYLAVILLVPDTSGATKLRLLSYMKPENQPEHVFYTYKR